jgi:hypothetical protein
MAFIDVFNAANDATFQGRCMAAAWQTAQHVVAGDEGYNVTPQSRDFAYELLRDKARITPRQVAMQVLRNLTIAGNVAASTDSDIDWQVKQVWTDLAGIG